jgi:hypothetical protein
LLIGIALYSAGEFQTSRKRTPKQTLDMPQELETLQMGLMVEIEKEQAVTQ